MSLYSGIKFSDPEGARIAQEQAERDSALARGSDAAAPTQTGASSRDPAIAVNDAADAFEKPASTPSFPSTAALKFAPVIRKKAPSAQRPGYSGPPASAIAALAKPTVVAPPTAHSAPNGGSAVGAPLASTSTATFATQETEKRIKPPSLTLDEDDVNGFRQTAAGKKAAQKNKKKRKRNNKQRGEDPQLAFTSIPYDPARPCDYIAYKSHVEAKRAEKLRRHSSDSEYESSEEERSDDERILTRERLFAPPASYDDNQASQSGEAYATPAQVENAAVMTQETAEEAYQRRLAMSQRQQESGEDAYQRRLAMSQQRAQPSPSSQTATAPSQAASSLMPSNTIEATPSALPQFVAPSFVPSASSGVSHPVPAASSQGATPSSTVNAPALGDAAQRAREIAARLTKMGGARPPINTALQPNPEKPDFIPPSAGSSTASMASTSVPPTGEEWLDDVFANLEQETEAAKPDNRPFAQRMMSQWGYEKGKGLGKEETGMTKALRMETAAQQAKKKGAAPTQGEQGANLKGRGTIVDSTKKERIAGEREKYGEPSRIVLLTNMCGLEDIDEDLPNEVAEEASRFGLVERVFIYPVPNEVRPEEKVRIFLVMSGLAGGYNAVKTFDQRFFAGRTVRARYYDEKMFQIHRYDL